MTTAADTSTLRAIPAHHENDPPALSRLIALGALVLIILRPISNNRTLIPLLFVLGSLALVGKMRETRTGLPSDVRLSFGLVIWVGVMFSAIGAWRQTPGFMYGLVTWIGGPVVFMLVATCARRADIHRFFRLLPWITIYISLGLVINAAVARGFDVPSPLRRAVNLLDQGSFANAQVGIVESRYYALSSLIGLVPVVLVLLVSPPAPGRLPPRWLVAIASGLGVVAALLSGRRALELVVVVTPVLAFVLARIWGVRFVRWRLATRAVVAAAGIAVTVVVAFRLFRLTPGAYAASFTGDGSGAGGGDYALRSDQATTLVRVALDHPVFGHGVGAVIDGYVRNRERPWNFELQYPLIFFQMGVVGVSVLLVAAGTMLRSIHRAVMGADDTWRALHLAAFACSLAILIANATNPYLQAVGHQWMLFLPAALIAANARPDVAG